VGGVSPAPFVLLLIACERSDPDAGELSHERARDIAARFGRLQRLTSEWIQARPELTFDDLRELRSAMDHPTNVKAAVAAGQAQWADTVVALEEQAFKGPRDRQCVELLGPLLREPCAYSVAMSAERTSPTSGTIRLTKELCDKEEGPFCCALASCIVAARIGRALPLPEGLEARIGVVQDVMTVQSLDQLRDALAEAPATRR
jgi:hypothetical protein